MEFTLDELKEKKTDLNWIPDVDEEVVSLFLRLSYFPLHYLNESLLLVRREAPTEISHHE